MFTRFSSLSLTVLGTDKKESLHTVLNSHLVMQHLPTDAKAVPLTVASRNTRSD
jgi:hypothetical protein